MCSAAIKIFCTSALSLSFCCCSHTGGFYVLYPLWAIVQRIRYALCWDCFPFTMREQTVGMRRGKPTAQFHIRGIKVYSFWTSRIFTHLLDILLEMLPVPVVLTVSISFPLVACFFCFFFCKYYLQLCAIYCWRSKWLFIMQSTEILVWSWIFKCIALNMIVLMIQSHDLPLTVSQTFPVA